jgi:hypothetical protein
MEPAGHIEACRFSWVQIAGNSKPAKWGDGRHPKVASLNFLTDAFIVVLTCVSYWGLPLETSKRTVYGMTWLWGPPKSFILLGSPSALSNVWVDQNCSAHWVSEVRSLLHQIHNIHKQLLIEETGSPTIVAHWRRFQLHVLPEMQPSNLTHGVLVQSVALWSMTWWKPAWSQREVKMERHRMTNSPT